MLIYSILENLVNYQFCLFRSTLVGAAAAFVAFGAAFGATAFFVAVPLMPLIVPITVLFGGAFFATAALVTTVPELPLLVSLLVLTLPLPAFRATGAAAVLFPLPTPADELPDDDAVTVRAAAPRVAFAFSTIFVKMLAAPPPVLGAVGFKGETGRDRCDLAGDTVGRVGDGGNVRELADLGERT